MPSTSRTAPDLSVIFSGYHEHVGFSFYTAERLLCIFGPTGRPAYWQQLTPEHLAEVQALVEVVKEEGQLKQR